MKKLPFFIFLLLLLSSCGPAVMFEKTYEINEEGWIYADVLPFEINVQDTLKIYDLYLDIEHTPEFPKQNIYFKIHTKFPKGEKLSEKLSVDLMNKQGNWLGDCSSSTCKRSFKFQSGAFFNSLGKHTIILEQFMRFEPLPAVNEIGLRIVETGQQRTN